VIFIYVLVSLGATMLVGAEKLIENKEVSLIIAGQKILGTPGLVIVTIAAAFSTGSAINATLFSTARLTESVSEKNQLPKVFGKENSKKIPYFSILFIAGFAILLAVVGNLSILVDSASVIFLFTFGVVNLIAFTQKVKWRFFCLMGFILCLMAIILSVLEQWKNNPFIILVIILSVVFIFIFRPLILKKLN
jgi:hypothetical protein